MQVESTALLLVIVSGFVHAVWNLFTKQSTSKPHFLLLCQVVSVSLYLPVAIVWFWSHTIPTAGWGLILISTLIHGAYIWLLSRVYTIGDLSKAYPIVRGTGPLLVPIIAVLALGESLSIYGWIAVVCIVAGILTLADLRSGVTQLHRDHVLMTSLAIGLCVTGYTLVDKVLLHYTSAIAANSVAHLGNLAAMSYYLRDKELVRAEWKLNRRNILLVGIFAPGGYLLFLFALSLAPVSHMAPMREIGTVFGSIFGIRLLRESGGVRRIVGGILITAGVISLGLFG